MNAETIMGHMEDSAAFHVSTCRSFLEKQKQNKKKISNDNKIESKTTATTATVS